MANDTEILHDGRHLVLLRRNGWEYVEHRTAPEAAMVVALTDGGEIVLAEEFRPPMNAPVVSLPSGLIGDEGTRERDRCRAPRARRRDRFRRLGLAASRARAGLGRPELGDDHVLSGATGRPRGRAGGARRRQDPRPRRARRGPSRVDARARGRGLGDRSQDLGGPLPGRAALSRALLAPFAASSLARGIRRGLAAGRRT